MTLDPEITSILIVDDQALVRSGFRLMLDTQPDLRVIGEAGDGREGLDLARRQRPDVVLMDVRMPVMDGIEATREIVAESGPTRVLILTTFDADELVYDAVLAGGRLRGTGMQPQRALELATTTAARAVTVLGARPPGPG